MSQTTSKNRERFGAVLAVYLLGLLIGGLYVGMVAPVRTVIQESFGINDAQGIWIISIYTLFYAALIPVIGKLADRYGRKRVFVVCVCAFATGSAVCGLSGSIGSLELLLAGRVAQAAGAGGMIPVANAEMGTAFPPEKRGLALGIAAGVAGIANIAGSAVGSAVLGLIGNENWPWLFYAATPIGIALALCAQAFLNDRDGRPSGKLDVAGAVVFTLLVFCLLLGLKEFDPFDALSLLSPLVYLPAIGALILGLCFRAVERRAEDPIFHMEYLRSRPIVITMCVSFFIGCSIVSMMLVPQYAEFVTGSTVGSGGYYVLAVGILSLFGPPICGKVIDRIGPKPPLMAGIAVMAAAFLFLALVVTPNPSAPLLVAGLAAVGLGMGFAMGAPTNYMALANTDPADAGATIATIALVRQIGTTVAPAIFVGFIASNPGVAGYQAMLLCVCAFNVAAFALMLFYRTP